MKCSDEFLRKLSSKTSEIAWCSAAGFVSEIRSRKGGSKKAGERSSRSLDKPELMDFVQVLDNLAQFRTRPDCVGESERGSGARKLPPSSGYWSRQRFLALQLGGTAILRIVICGLGTSDSFV